MSSDESPRGRRGKPRAPEAPPSAFGSIDPPRNFTLSTEERIRALAIGAPAYAQRKRRIEDAEAKMLEELVALAEALAERGLDEAAVRVALLAKANSFDLEKINRLIRTHNRYYPIEANLRIDFRTGDYLVHGRPWLPEIEWTAELLVARALAAVAAA